MIDDLLVSKSLAAMGLTTASVQFERVGNSPGAWHSVADNLLFASQVLAQQCDAPEQLVSTSGDQLSSRTRLGAIELMLKGMAMECLLKALCLKQGHLFVSAGKFEPVSNAGAHNLVQLAKAVTLNPTKFEIDLLKRLQHFIEYGGRYPIPKLSNELRLTTDPRGGKSAGTTWHGVSDNQLFEALVRQIVDLLSQ